MDVPQHVQDYDKKFLKFFSVGAGIVLGTVALYMLFSIFSMLSAVS